MTPEYTLLSRSERNGLEEEQHFGLIVTFDKKGTVKSIGKDNDYPFFHRSCMKPMQLASISEIIEAFDLTDEEITVSTSSHTGSSKHIQTVRNVLKKAGLSEKDLLCPPWKPIDADMTKELIKSDKQPSAIHNNCSGKHAAMLAYCKLKGFDISNYNQLSHPLQKHVLSFVADFCEVNLSEVKKTTELCMLPVIATPLKNLAKGLLKVFTENKYDKITNAILNCPELIGGKNRIDSEIIKAGNRRLIAKVGVGNLCCVIDLKDKTCTIIKLIDPDYFARGFALSNYLNKTGKIANFEQSNLYKLYPPFIKDFAGNTTGEVKVLFNV